MNLPIDRLEAYLYDKFHDHIFSFHNCLPASMTQSSLAWIIHEDSASRGNLARRVGQSYEKRGPLTYQKGAEEDGSRCDARFSLASNRHTAIKKRGLESGLELYT